MKRIYLFGGVGCFVALFAVTAFSQGFQGVPANPEADFTARSLPPQKSDSPTAKNAAVASKPCCRTAECALAVKATAVASKQQDVYYLLEKLEALKAKQDALESEIRETRALLGEKFRRLQERVGKATMTPRGSPYAPAITPVTSQHYEPVTSYRVVLVKNPETGETQRVTEAVTSYVLRQGVPTVTTYGVPLKTPPSGAPAQTVPAPCVPVTAPTVAPAPVIPPTVTTPEPRPRPVKATKTDRPVDPATEMPTTTITPVSPKYEPQPKSPKTPPTATPSPK